MTSPVSGKPAVRYDRQERRTGNGVTYTHGAGEMLIHAHEIAARHGWRVRIVSLRGVSNYARWVVDVFDPDTEKVYIGSACQTGELPDAVSRVWQILVTGRMP